MKFDPDCLHLNEDSLLILNLNTVINYITHDRPEFVNMKHVENAYVAYQSYPVFETCQEFDVGLVRFSKTIYTYLVRKKEN